MKAILCLFLCLPIFLFGSNCRKAASQVESNPVQTRIKEAKDVLLQTETNEKYKLSLLFYKIDDDSIPSIKIKIRNDKTGREIELYTIVEENLPPAARRFWSPDEEHLLLHHNGLWIYQTAEMAKHLNKKDFSTDEFFRKAKTADSIEILTDKQNSEFRHAFVKWQDKDSFVFKISRQSRKNEATPYEAVGEFRYDFVKRQLYRRTKQDYGSLSPDEQKKYTMLSQLLGKNKNGLIAQSDIKSEPVE